MKKYFVVFWNKHVALVPTSKYKGKAENVLAELKKGAEQHPDAQSGIVFVIDPFTLSCHVMYMSDFDVYKVSLNGESFVKISWITGEMADVLAATDHKSLTGIAEYLDSIPDSDFKNYILSGLKEKGVKVVSNDEAEEIPETDWFVFVLDKKGGITEQTVSAADYAMESPVDYALRTAGKNGVAAFGFDDATGTELAFASGATTFQTGKKMSEIAAKIDKTDTVNFLYIIEHIKKNISAITSDSVATTESLDYVEAKKICEKKTTLKIQSFIKKFKHPEYAEAIIEVCKTFNFKLFNSEINDYVRKNVFVVESKKKKGETDRYYVMNERDSNKFIPKGFLRMMPQASNGCYVMKESEIRSALGDSYPAYLVFSDPSRIKALAEFLGLKPKQVFKTAEIPSTKNNNFETPDETNYFVFTEAEYVNYFGKKLTDKYSFGVTSNGYHIVDTDDIAKAHSYAKK